MVNKKGIIRTLEAIIAIVLVLIFIYTVMPKQEIKVQENPIKTYERFIIKDISYNETIRGNLMQVTDVGGCDKDCEETAYCSSTCKIVVEDISSLIRKTITAEYDFFFKICNQASCVSTKLPADRSIYMFDVLIGSDPATINPLIVRVWVWTK